MDRGAWWATVHRAQSLTRLKPLSLHTHTHICFFGSEALQSQLDIKFSSLSLKRFDTILLSSGIVTEDYSQPYFCSLIGFIFLYGCFCVYFSLYLLYQTKV